MFTAFRALALSAAIAALVASGGGLAPALQKDKDKKPEDKKAADKKGEEVGTVEVWKAKDGWRFKVLNASGKAIAGNYVPHEKKEDALKEVEVLKATLAKGKVEVKDEKSKDK
ncbi:hypothetical protein R5W24_003380 [Gemmata sp. JC717]|uniref:DUF1508 domain-containing protein n=1 Tax=Gemmata algarum TaxID=2975278 RepID=A0ABU5ETF8_9BACT|nr:hypothetical protein [Gemmata algarum]MDY3554261.1 hypothetical protein [Gemmata algarum]MDY3557907.1 hypothetical protein [Gemmata algarum]